jgi:hypothetical protein
MGCNKVPGAHGAVGYWGRSMYCRIQQEQTIPKIRALLQDQLLGGGLRVELWTSVHDVRDGEVAAPGTLKCTCVKASGKHADRRCLSCHGINYIPGYIKFGYETLWASSVTPGLTLTDVQLNTTLKPNRLELTQLATTGTIETTDLFFTRIYPNMLWEAKNSYVVKDSTTASVESFFSTDSGGTWHPLADLPSVNPTTGRIRFRIVLNRNTTSDPSPAWEILRARFPTIPSQGRMGPWLLILKTVSPDKNIQDPRGVVIDSANNSFWTAPLSFFDCGIITQTNVGATLDEGDMIRDPAFVQFMDGANNGEHPERWTLTNFAYSDPIGYLVRQFFQARLAQQEEFTWLVW